MDGAWLARMRWRRRGAWLWPAFVATIVLDALIGHLLPPAGSSQTLAGAAVLACFLNLFALLLLSRPLEALARRRRPDLPPLIARDYGGTAAVLAITVAVLAAGLIHRPTLTAQSRAQRDAIVRAQAFIGDRAPAEFRRNLALVDTYAIEPGHMYRVCVPNPPRTRTYCVVVDARRPFAQSVTFAGYESNATFAQGAG